MIVVIPDDRRAELLEYSRQLLSARLTRTINPEPPTNAPFLENRTGAFVTLRRDRELRGCIGRIETNQRLLETLTRVTVDAAFHDPRFASLSAEELPEIRIEHSILSPTRSVDTCEEIELGRHGIILELDRHRALFLPEVAAEQGWDLSQTLTALSQKARLQADAWRSPRCHFSVFESQHYGEPLGE